jgi:hypothetical protein
MYKKKKKWVYHFENKYEEVLHVHEEVQKRWDKINR